MVLKLCARISAHTLAPMCAHTFKSRGRAGPFPMWFRKLTRNGGFVDLTNPHPKIKTYSEQEIARLVYYENKMRQLNFNPALLVLALAVYVLLLFLGLLCNTRVVSIIRRRVRRNPFAFDIRLIELDIFTLCSINLLSLLCFMFVIIDLAYGQWMLPSKILCRFYLSAEGFTRIVSGMVLVHLALLCAYFVTKIREEIAPPFTFSLFTKVSSHYFYVWVICPIMGLILAIVLFQHGNVQESTNVVLIENTINDTEIVINGKCVLMLSDRMSTSLTIYGSICGYLAPVTAFFASALLCRCRCKNISDNFVRRYVPMVIDYGLMFFLCHTPAWSMSIFDYFLNLDLIKIHHAIATAYLSYFAHIFTYLTCIGYPIFYLRSLNMNRISNDASCDSFAGTRSETGMSLTSVQQFSVGRDLSRDVLLRQPQMRSRSRTTSSLQVANLDKTIVTISIERNPKHSSYQFLGNAKEEEDQF